MLSQLKSELAQKIAPSLHVSPAEVENLLEVPKSLEHGHLALPVFFLAKVWRKAPPVIAGELVNTLSSSNLGPIEKMVAVGGYVNFYFNDSHYQQTLLNSVMKAGDELGWNASGAGEVMAIDFSSPNVAKPMHVGHLRATVIGQAIYNLAKTQGYKVIGINHLGDWGVQFGKVAWAYQQWAGEYDFQNHPFESLYELYVRFHEEAERQPELNAKGSAVFKRLEDGDPELRKLWQWFIDISMAEYNKLWQLMGIQHDLVRGESFYNDRLPQVENLLKEKGLLVESQGAMVVPLEDEGMPPCLIRKSDGASLYATRDLASAIYRAEELKAAWNLYVTGMDQNLHFKQVFAVLTKMGYSWAKNCRHISFGMYRFKGKMSSRKGNVVFLRDIVDKAIDMVSEIIGEKNPDLKDKERVARQVGVGAVIFNDLVNDRLKNVEFDWERVLDFEGDSGPYVQYTQVRCQSLIKKYAQPLSETFSCVLESPEERELIKRLMNYRDILKGAFDNFKPHTLAVYLLEVCQCFNHFYHKHRVLGEQAHLEQSRMALVFCTMKVLQSGLKVLNIESPEAM